MPREPFLRFDCVFKGRQRARALVAWNSTSDVNMVVHSRRDFVVGCDACVRAHRACAAPRSSRRLHVLVVAGSTEKVTFKAIDLFVWPLLSACGEGVVRAGCWVDWCKWGPRSVDVSVGVCFETNLYRRARVMDVHIGLGLSLEKYGKTRLR